jgi:hypothetical protein
MAALRATARDQKSTLIAVLRLDRAAQEKAKAIEAVQMDRLNRGLNPSRSWNPLLDKPLEPRIEE